jgi:hypothetical protein
LAKTNYTFEKRQREIAKKKQQDEKKARKKSGREGPDEPNGAVRSPSSGQP